MDLDYISYEEGSSVLVPGESFSPTLTIKGSGGYASAPAVSSSEPAPLARLASAPTSSGINWALVLIAAGVLLLLLGGRD